MRRVVLTHCASKAKLEPMKRILSHKINITLLLIGLGFLVLLFSGNYLKLVSGCVHATDFSIYQQAIYDINFFNNLNPYITIRNLKIFNDHFDPILLLASPFAWLFSYESWALLLFEFLWFLSVIVVALTNLKDYSIRDRLLAVLCIILSKGLLSGLVFPIHPSTWAMLPFFLISMFLCQKNKTGVLVSGMALCLFKESFPFAVIALGIFLLTWDGWKRQSVILIIVGIIFQIFNFHFRSIWLGGVESYGSTILNSQLFTKIINNDYVPLLKIIYPFAPFFYLLFFKERIIKQYRDPFFAVLFLIAPLLAIHLISGNFHLQYGPQFIAPLLAVLFFHPKVNFSKLSSKLKIVTVLLFLGSSISIYTKEFNLVVRRKSPRCSTTSEHRENLRNLKQFFIALDKPVVLATGGLVPSIMIPEAKIYQAGLYSKKISFYDYAFIATPKTSNSYPFDYDLREMFTCEKVKETTSYTIFKNVDLNCMPAVLRP